MPEAVILRWTQLLWLHNQDEQQVTVPWHADAIPGTNLISMGIVTSRKAVICIYESVICQPHQKKVISLCLLEDFLQILYLSAKIQQELHCLTDLRLVWNDLWTDVLPHNLDGKKSTPPTLVPQVLQKYYHLFVLPRCSLCFFAMDFGFFCGCVTTFYKKSRFGCLGSFICFWLLLVIVWASTLFSEEVQICRFHEDGAVTH